MQMKKKCAAVLAAAALVLSMAACSESKPAAESSSAASSAPSSSSEASVPEKTEAPKLEDYQKDLNAVMEKLVPDMNEFLTLDQNSDDYLDQVVGILQQHQHGRRSRRPGNQGGETGPGYAHMKAVDGQGVARNIDQVHSHGGYHGNFGVVHGTEEGRAGIVHRQEGIGQR